MRGPAGDTYRPHLWAYLSRYPSGPTSMPQPTRGQATCTAHKSHNPGTSDNPHCGTHMESCTRAIYMYTGGESLVRLLRIWNTQIPSKWKMRRPPTRHTTPVSILILSNNLRGGYRLARSRAGALWRRGCWPGISHTLQRQLRHQCGCFRRPPFFFFPPAAAVSAVLLLLPPCILSAHTTLVNSE